jgi:tetratricopeptide (TPR) repeat protein
MINYDRYFKVSDEAIMSRVTGMCARRSLIVGLLAGLLLVVGIIAWWQYPRQYLRQGEAALAAREYAVARRYIDRYLSYRPHDTHAHLLAARACRLLRDYYDAYEHLHRSRENGGDTEAIAIEFELIAVQRGEEPSFELRKRAEQSDDLAQVILEVLIQYDIDDYRLWQALHGLTHYLEIRPDDLQALLARGYVWERFLYFADALEDYRRAVASHPNNEKSRLKLAQTLLIAGTPDEALEHFEWLVQRLPEHHEVMLGLARCRRRLNQPEEARILLDTLLAQSVENGEVLWERGLLELDAGRAAQAEDWLQRAVRANPHDRRIVYSLSRCLLALGRREEAEQLNARVAEIDADLRRIEQIRQGVMDRPHDAALRYEGGVLFLRNGDRDEGIRWLRRALQLDSQYQAAREKLAEVENQ